MTVPDLVRVAAFDVDGTLTDRDCVVPFLRLVRGIPVLAGRLLARPDLLVGKAARRDRDGLKALAARAAFRGRAVPVVEAQATSFADDVIASSIRHDTERRVAKHLDAGEVVVLVSASFEVYLHPLADRLGAVDALGTRLVVGPDDTFTGELDGPNCRAAEKVVRLHAWLDQHHGGRAAVRLTAYGDSTGDREMLLDVDEAHWLGSGRPPSWLPGSTQ